MLSTQIIVLSHCHMLEKAPVLSIAGPTIVPVAELLEKDMGNFTIPMAPKFQLKETGMVSIATEANSS